MNYFEGIFDGEPTPLEDVKLLFSKKSKNNIKVKEKKIPKINKQYTNNISMKTNQLNAPTSLSLEDFAENGYLNDKSKSNRHFIANTSIGVYNELFNKGIVDSSPAYQRPYTYKDKDGGEGSFWQRNLIGSIFRDEFIQPIHIRYRKKGKKIVEKIKSIFYNILEILDGGHRTRTICSFISNKIKTPKNLFININGDTYDISNRHFYELDDFIKNYFLSIEVLLCFHFNLSNDEAGERFRTLNNLHSMSRQEKRSSFYRHIAKNVRNIGAVDFSKYKMFSEIESNNSFKYTNLSLEKDSRVTDEVVANLFYIFSNMDAGKINSYKKPSPKLLDDMYENDIPEDLDESSSKFNTNSDTYKRVIKSLEFIDKLSVSNINNKCVNFSKKRLTKSSIVKLAMFFDWIFSTKNGSKLKIENFDTSVFWKQLYDTVSSIKIPHIELQTYKIHNNQVVVDRKGGKDKKVIPSAWNVWGTGDRLDDMQYIILHLMVQFDTVAWGFEKTKKDNTREFTDSQREYLYKEQNGICPLTGKALKDIKYEADHIISWSLGGPTTTENGRLVCETANKMKSSGVSIDDIKYLCKKVNFTKVDSLIDMFETNTSTLLPEDIELVLKKVLRPA